MDTEHHILRPEHRAHDWKFHESPKCAECRTCGETVGAKYGEELNVHLRGCKLLVVK